VELGGQRGERRIVTKGLQAGEQVIVKGLQRVRPDQKVEAEPESAHIAGSSIDGPTFKTAQSVVHARAASIEH
jgi:hypothetical protein